MYCYACILFTDDVFLKSPFLFIVWCFQQAKESELPGLVFSSWYQRKKARFFCSLRSEPCCRSQWEIRLWLMPGWREAEWDPYIRKAGIFHTHQLIGHLEGPFVGPVAHTNLLPEQPPPGRCVCSPGTTWSPLWSQHCPACKHMADSTGSIENNSTVVQLHTWHRITIMGHKSWSTNNVLQNIETSAKCFKIGNDYILFFGVNCTFNVAFNLEY